jgi:hypothetical protein
MQMRWEAYGIRSLAKLERYVSDIVHLTAAWQAIGIQHRRLTSLVSRDLGSLGLASRGMRGAISRNELREGSLPGAGDRESRASLGVEAPLEDRGFVPAYNAAKRVPNMADVRSRSFGVPNCPTMSRKKRTRSM